MCFFSCDIDNCYCDICNDLVVYCVGLVYDVSLSQMIDNKVDSRTNKSLLLSLFLLLFCITYYSMHCLIKVTGKSIVQCDIAEWEQII